MTISEDRTGGFQQDADTSRTVTATSVNETVMAACAARNSADDERSDTGSSDVVGSMTAMQAGQRVTPMLANSTLRPVARGDVRVIKPLAWQEGSKRLAVVCRVDPDLETAEMMLTHPWPELATDTDAVIVSEDSDLPFPMVLECYVRGPVWLLQVCEWVGVLSETQMSAVGDAVVEGDLEAEGASTGLPLVGPADARWDFKAREVAEWRALTEDCAAVVSGENDEAWPLNPNWLLPHHYEQSPDNSTMSISRLHLEEMLHQISTRQVTVERQNIDPAALDLECWSESLGRDVGLAVFRALQPLLDRAALSQQSERLMMEAA